MSTLKNTLRLIGSARQFSRTAVVKANAGNVPEGYAKIKLLQAKFQKHDGLPVHLKGGVMDKALFGVTTVLCVVGLGMIVEMIYVLANPKRE